MLPLACAFLVCSFAAARTEEIGCTVENKHVNVGEQYNYPGSCGYNVCNGNNEWTRAACGLIGATHGWVYVPGDSAAGYPECCGSAQPPLDVVPDVLDPFKKSVPAIGVTYVSGVSAATGNELTPTQVKDKPRVSYAADPSAYYALCLTDPDAPSRAEPTSREFLHWLVVNIPGDRVSAGEVLADYVGSGPPRGTGLHRYVFVLYKQPSKLTFDEPRVSNTSAEHRPKFSIRNFAKKHKLGEPVALNLYLAQYDDYVPVLHRQLGLMRKN